LEYTPDRSRGRVQIFKLNYKAMKTKFKQPDKQQLGLIKTFGTGFNEVRFWKDKEGNVWYDPHPKVDLIPGTELFLIKDFSKDLKA